MVLGIGGGGSSPSLRCHRGVRRLAVEHSPRRGTPSRPMAIHVFTSLGSLRLLRRIWSAFHVKRQEAERVPRHGSHELVNAGGTEASPAVGSVAAACVCRRFVVAVSLPRPWSPFAATLWSLFAAVLVSYLTRPSPARPYFWFLCRRSPVVPPIRSLASRGASVLCLTGTLVLRLLCRHFPAVLRCRAVAAPPCLGSVLSLSRRISVAVPPRHACTSVAVPSLSRRASDPFPVSVFQLSHRLAALPPDLATTFNRVCIAFLAASAAAPRSAAHPFVPDRPPVTAFSILCSALSHSPPSDRLSGQLGPLFANLVIVPGGHVSLSSEVLARHLPGGESSWVSRETPGELTPPRFHVKLAEPTRVALHPEHHRVTRPTNACDSLMRTGGWSAARETAGRPCSCLG